MKRQGQALIRCDAAECHVGPVVIVGPQPSNGKFPNFIERFKEMVSQPIVANGPVVKLHVRVLLMLTSLDEIDADAASGDPIERRCADVCRAVVTADRARFPMPFDNPVQQFDNAFGW